MITLESLNIDAICYYLDDEVNRFAEYIESVYNKRSSIVVYEVKENYDLLLFDFVNKNEIIDSINECLDGIEVSDFKIEYDFKSIHFALDGFFFPEE